MKYIFTLLMVFAIVAVTSTVAPTSAKAVTAVPFCGEWSPNATQAVNNGAHIVASNQTSQGTYITVEITCVKTDGGCAPTCFPYEVTLQHVYFYPSNPE